MKSILSFLILLIASFPIYAQQLQPGFDKEEYRELMLISAVTGANPSYSDSLPHTQQFKMLYQSQAIGLDNLWDLWINEDKVCVISLRGTTGKSESWLANFYAAMVPAKGVLTLNGKEQFSYQLANHPQAAVHVGWLISMAYLSQEIVPKIKEQYQNGTREFIIMGHSQGGAIAYLLNSYLFHLQRNNELPQDMKFKTYCSAAPKPGNLFYSYEYEAMTQGGWAFNVVNAADWVPETPISIQTLNDFTEVNPFVGAKPMIKKLKFPNNLVLNHVYNQLDKPTKKAQRKYEKYLGRLISKMIGNHLPNYTPPQYFKSNNYVRTGTSIVLLPTEAYYEATAKEPQHVFIHHSHKQYLKLLDNL